MRRGAIAFLLVVACGGNAVGEGTLGFRVQMPEDLGVAHLSAERVDAIVAGVEEPPVYSSVPATSGPHASAASPCGVFRQEVPEIFNVHSLEHGVVIVYYQPSEADPESVTGVESAAKEFQTHIIVMPRTEMPTPVALVSWGHLAALDELDVDQVRSFWGEYAQRGPESGIPCPYAVDEAS